MNWRLAVSPPKLIPYSFFRRIYSVIFFSPMKIFEFFTPRTNFKFKFEKKLFDLFAYAYALQFIQLTSLVEISEILNISILNLMKSECFDKIQLGKLIENN